MENYDRSATGTWRPDTASELKPLANRGLFSRLIHQIQGGMSRSARESLMRNSKKTWLIWYAEITIFELLSNISVLS